MAGHFLPPWARMTRNVSSASHRNCCGRRGIRHADRADGRQLARSRLRPSIPETGSRAGCAGYFGVSPVRCVDASGRVKWKQAPPSGDCSLQMRPSCASTIVRQIDRPSPMPEALVLRNGENSSAAISGASPGPLSATSTWIIRSLSRRLLTSSRRKRAPAIASIAFLMRLRKTCWTWIRSTRTTWSSRNARTEIELVASGAQQRQRARLVDQAGKRNDLPFALPARDEVAQPPHDLAGAHRFGGAFVERLADDLGGRRNRDRPASRSPFRRNW